MDRVGDFSAYAAARWPALVRSAVFLGCGVEEAEDLVQTTLVKCYAAWRRVERADNRDAYVYRVLVNAHRDSRRRHWWREQPSDLTRDRRTTGDTADRVAITDAVARALGDLSAVKVTTEVDGNPVVETGAVCTMSDSGVCRQSFGIPDLHAFFTVTSPGGNMVAAIRDSSTLLPNGQTTVPFVSPGSPVGAWEVALRDAGLVARMHHTMCPDNALCMFHGPIETAPAAGNVVVVGSTVTVEVMDP